MTGRRPPYLAAAIAGLSVFTLYVVTLAPTTGFWDASEYITTAFILGIPHPPGNPLFVVLARVWLVLLEPTGLSVAVRVNLFAAATSASAAGLYFLVAHRLLTPVLKHDRAALVGAAVSMLLGATAFTVWNQSNLNEKVYTVSVLAIALATWLTLRWRDRAEEPASVRYLLWAALVLSLGSTNHLMSVLTLPALGLFVLLVRPGALMSRALWLRGVPLVLLGLSFNFFLPIRAAEDPAINEGDPTCETVSGAATAVFTLGRRGCPALAHNLTRGQYEGPERVERQAPFGHQLLTWYQYFDWQWSRGADASELPGSGGRTPFTLLFAVLGFAGLWAVTRSDRAAGVYSAVLAIVLTVALVHFLDFKYGYSLALDVSDLRLHEVRERDYFFIAGFGFWGVLAGMGLCWCWAVLAERVGGGARGLLRSSPVLAFAVVPLVLNWGWASRAGDYAARDWAWDILASVEPYGVIFTNGDNDTFPLWYLQEVEGLRQDVTVVVGEYLFTDWYLKQLQTASQPDRQRAFVSRDVPGLYQATEVPDGAITRLSFEQMDSVIGGALPADQTIPFGPVALQFPEGMYLSRGQRLALAIIRDSLDRRPIYFSSTAGMMSDIGLAPFAVRQGLVTKLVLGDPSQDPALVQGSPEYGAEWFDAERSLHLYREVYRFRGLRDRDVWSDRATLNIPWHFYALALQLSDIARQRGEPETAVAEFEADGAAFGVVSQGGAKGTPTAPEG